MIEATLEIAVQEAGFTTVRSDMSTVIPKSWDCGILFVKYLNGFLKFFVGGELQIVKVLFFVPT